MRFSRKTNQPPLLSPFAIQSHGGAPVKPGQAPDRLISSAVIALLAAGALSSTIRTSYADDQKIQSAVKARRFDLKVLKRSTSQRVLMVEMGPVTENEIANAELGNGPTDPRPEVGRVLLLKKADKPVLGVRVIKHYPGSNRMAVRRVRNYNFGERLEISDRVLALMKIGEWVRPEYLPEVIAADNADLRELEGGPAPVPHSTQQGTPPPPPPPAEPAIPEPEPAPPPESAPPAAENPPPPPPANNFEDTHFDEDLPEDEGVEISVEETKDLDPHHHAISVGYGTIANGTNFWSAGGIRYAKTIASRMFARNNHVQDTFALEAGLYLYQLDTNSVLTSIGTARYNIWLGSNFSPFIYAGLLYNYATPGAGGTNESADAATGLNTAAGIGFMFQFAPQWELRFDIGMDMLGAGLMLRF